MVVDRSSPPGRRTVDGKCGWFGESGSAASRRSRRGADTDARPSPAPVAKMVSGVTLHSRFCREDLDRPPTSGPPAARRTWVRPSPLPKHEVVIVAAGTRAAACRRPRSARRWVRRREIERRPDHAAQRAGRNQRVIHRRKNTSPRSSARDRARRPRRARQIEVRMLREVRHRWRVHGHRRVVHAERVVVGERICHPREQRTRVS